MESHLGVQNGKRRCEASCSTAPERRSRQRKTLVRDISTERGTTVCAQTDTLGEACDALLATGRTAALVLDVQQKIYGALTENDILAALLAGTSRTCPVDQWLRSCKARLPCFMVEPLTLPCSFTLAEAARFMVGEAEKDSGFARHHVLVTAPEASPARLLSALDLACALIDAKIERRREASQQEASAEAPYLACGPMSPPRPSPSFSGTTVSHAMKDLASMAICKLSDTVSEAFQIMFESRQNAVLVVAEQTSCAEEVPEPCSRRVCGIMTGSDVLRSFSNGTRGNLTVKDWLDSCMPAEEAVLQRSIVASVTLPEAVKFMASTGVHHLVVRAVKGTEVVGVLSALDIVCALGYQEEAQSSGA